MPGAQQRCDDDGSIRTRLAQSARSLAALDRRHRVDRSVVLFRDARQFAVAAGAYVHVGAMLGTIMVANVFFHILPGQKEMVADIRAGREPDPRPGIIGKQRSVHNTYFTLPVLFTMISNHYPMTYSHPHGWLILCVIMLAGVLIRQFFVLRHRGNVKWTLPAVGIALLAATAVAIAPKGTDPSGGKV